MTGELARRWAKAGRDAARSAFALFSLLALLATPSRQASADSDPSNDSDRITVQLLPVVDLGVIVDTAGAAWTGSSNLDAAMDLGAERLLATGVKVTVVGNLNLQELELQGAALNAWTLDTDEVDGADQLRLYGLFAAEGAAAPASGAFSGGTANLITGAVKRAGQPEASELTDSSHTYELATSHASYAEMDNMPVGAVRRLWLRANTPSFSTQDTTQAFTVTITAVSGIGQ